MPAKATKRPRVASGIEPVPCSITARKIYAIEEFAAIEPALQEIQEYSCFAFPQAIANGAGVWSEQKIGRLPKRAIRA